MITLALPLAAFMIKLPEHLPEQDQVENYIQKVKESVETQKAIDIEEKK